MKTTTRAWLLTLLAVLLSVTAAAQDQNKQIATEFEKRVKDYVKLREDIEAKMPKLSKEARAEEIAVHKKQLQESVRAARAGAKHGDIFTPEAAALVRATIKDEFKGKDRVELLKTVLVESEVKALPLRVNYPYPETKEQLEMPPPLLLRLPQLPKQVRYRFVGDSMLLVDRENGLILDYMTGALPPITNATAQQLASKPVTTSAPVAPARTAPGTLLLPNKESSVRFVVIGDTGTGTNKQHELADVLLRYRQMFPFEFVLMMGDNMYGSEQAVDYKTKFEDVYRPLLDQKVKFYAALGNHDDSNQRFYQYFNMEGQEYYHFKKGNVSFYSLNSNYMDKKQVDWINEKLATDNADWKVAYFHHPPYSSGGAHGSDTKLREIVEPIFVKNHVNVVFTGHEHFYERIKPQKGVYYFISGSGGKLRKGDVKKGSPLTDKAYDSDLSFMLIEVAGDQMHFQVISRTGETVDSGIIARSTNGRG